MNIAQWPLSKKMQLPDEHFGRRYSIHTSQMQGLASTTYAVAAIALPEDFVIWGLSIYLSHDDVARALVRIKMGDQVPPDAAAFNALEDMFPGFDVPSAVGVNYGFSSREPYIISGLKLPRHAVGRRMIVEFTTFDAGVFNCKVDMIISTIPLEIPD